MTGPASAWDFFEISESSAGGGDLQRFLRATQLSAADMLARETIQNSWDAARKLRAIVKVAWALTNAPPEQPPHPGWIRNRPIHSAAKL